MSGQRGAVHYDVDVRGVATITLDRPEKLNALSLEMIAQLQEAIVAIRRAAPRVVVVRSLGDRAFCVGADIQQFAGFSAIEMWRRWIADGHRVFRELAELTQPTIAVLQGPTFGGGLELALSCDLRVASENATFALPETGIGTIPGWGGTETLTRTIGRPRASEMILARRRIDAAKAERWGLITEVHPVAELDAAAAALVDEILGGAPLAQQTSKQLVRAATEGASAAVLEALASGFTASTHEFAEGLSAFLEKRTPNFTSTPTP